MAKFKFQLFIAAAFMAVFAFIGAELYSANASINTLTTEVNQLHADKAEKQAEVNMLAAELDLSEFTLGRVLAERESIAAIRAQADAEAERLRIDLADAEHQVAQLRVSHDEHVKEWANAAVPADAVRLLKYATQGGNQNGDGNQGGLSNTTSRLVAQLSADYSF
jgi:chromosome segregation ATPase